MTAFMATVGVAIDTLCVAEMVCIPDPFFFLPPPPPFSESQEGRACQCTGANTLPDDPVGRDVVHHDCDAQSTTTTKQWMKADSMLLEAKPLLWLLTLGRHTRRTYVIHSGSS